MSATYTADELREAVLAERERCALIVEGRAQSHSASHLLTLEMNQMAAVLRSGLGWLQYERSKR